MKHYISNLATKVDGVIIMCSPYNRILEYVISHTSHTHPTQAQVTFKQTTIAFSGVQHFLWVVQETIEMLHK